MSDRYYYDNDKGRVTFEGAPVQDDSDWDDENTGGYYDGSDDDEDVLDRMLGPNPSGGTSYGYDDGQVEYGSDYYPEWGMGEEVIPPIGKETIIKGLHRDNVTKEARIREQRDMVGGCLLALLVIIITAALIMGLFWVLGLGLWSCEIKPTMEEVFGPGEENAGQTWMCLRWFVGL